MSQKAKSKHLDEQIEQLFQDLSVRKPVSETEVRSERMLEEPIPLLPKSLIPVDISFMFTGGLQGVNSEPLEFLSPTKKRPVESPSQTTRTSNKLFVKASTALNSEIVPSESPPQPSVPVSTAAVVISSAYPASKGLHAICKEHVFQKGKKKKMVAPPASYFLLEGISNDPDQMMRKPSNNHTVKPAGTDEHSYKKMKLKLLQQKKFLLQRQLQQELRIQQQQQQQQQEKKKKKKEQQQETTLVQQQQQQQQQQQKKTAPNTSASLSPVTLSPSPKEGRKKPTPRVTKLFPFNYGSPSVMDSPTNTEIKSQTRDPSADTHIQVDLQSRSVTDESISGLFTSVINQIEQKKALIDASKGEKLSINVCLEKNKLSCKGISQIVEFLLPFSSILDVCILRLHMNRIGDEGARALARLVVTYSVRELHLSHNYITSEGFQALVEAIATSPSYPIVVHMQKKTETRPLWLRLEYNLIQWKQSKKWMDDFWAAHLLASKKLSNGRSSKRTEHEELCCIVDKRSKGTYHTCQIYRCRLGPKIKLHLPFIFCQKERLERMVSFQSLLRTPEEIISSKLQGHGNDPEAITEKEQQQQLPPLENEKVMQSEKTTAKEPLLLLLDTCSIILMSSQGNSPLNFQQLLSRKKNNLLSEDVKFVLIDTVFQQLDERKKQTRSPVERIAIKNFFDSYLMAAKELGVILFIHPMDLEDEVRANGGEISRSDFRKQTGAFDSDGFILDCALHLSRSFPSSVLLVTDDKGCKARALNYNLAAESTGVLESKLRDGGDAVNHLPAPICFDRAVFERALPLSTLEILRSTCTKTSPAVSIALSASSSSQVESGKTMDISSTEHTARLSRKSVIAELENASQLVSFFVSLIDQLHLQPEGPADHVKGWPDLARSLSTFSIQQVTNWNQLLMQHAKLLRGPSGLSSSPSSLSNLENPAIRGMKSRLDTLLSSQHTSPVLLVDPLAPEESQI